jgi:hypothetical protein
MTCSLRALARVFALYAHLIVLAATPLVARDQTVGLLQYDQASSFVGYTLLAPQQSPTIFLIDNYGRLVHKWEMTFISSSAVYLLPTGNLLRGAKTVDSAGVTGRTIQEIAWDGSLVWSYDYTSVHHQQHHDIEPLANGNVLLLANEPYTRAEAIAAGRDTLLMSTDTVNAEYVVEIRPTGPTSGDVVWEWHSWDHLIQDHDSTVSNFGPVEDHSELLDINYAPNITKDWIHANAIEYNEELDQIVISSRHFSELWFIDHSLSSAEASGHTGGNASMGGDILYRWGNPICYRAGTIDERQLFGPHDIQWIKPGLPGAGNILLFNNGWQRPGSNVSTIEEIITTVNGEGTYPQPGSGVAHGPDSPTWNYTADPATSFYSATISGTQRLPNGNTLICTGRSGLLFEVTMGGEVVWQYQSPVTNFGVTKQGDPVGSGVNVFRCQRFAPEHPGLATRDLTPEAPIELYDVTVAGSTHQPETPWWTDSVLVSCRVWSDSGVTLVEAYIDAGSGFQAIAMFDDGLHQDGEAGDSVYACVLPALVGATEVDYYIQAESHSVETTMDPPFAPGTAVYTYSIDHDFLCGDVDFSGAGPDISDLVYMIDWMFTGGSAPLSIWTVDVDGSGGDADISDLVYLVDYMFTGGPPPMCQ